MAAVRCAPGRDAATLGAISHQHAALRATKLGNAQVTNPRQFTAFLELTGLIE